MILTAHPPGVAVAGSVKAVYDTVEVIVSTAQTVDAAIDAQKKIVETSQLGAKADVKLYSDPKHKMTGKEKAIGNRGGGGCFIRTSDE